MPDCTRHRLAFSMFAAMIVIAILATIAPHGPGLAQSTDSQAPVVPQIEIAEADGGLWQRWSEFIIDFQRAANAEVATHMNAIERGDDLAAFFLGLGIAFLYGIIHAFGPGHGKFIIVSYFLGRDVRITRGVMMAVQVAIVHVIAAVVIVWLADVVLRVGYGMSLAEVPGVRAGSFLIIAAIGLYMLYQAIRAALGYIDPSEVGHGHSHGGAGGAQTHSHGHSQATPFPAEHAARSHSASDSEAHSHSHSHAHSHAQSHSDSHSHNHSASQSVQTTTSATRSGIVSASRTESSLMAFAAGVVPCPGAVLIMLYAVANNMIYPGFLLVGAMSIGIGLTVCLLGVGAIIARQTATRLVADESGGGSGVILLRHVLNFGGAIVVTIIGLVSFVAFLDIPIAAP
ncbi:MAG: hypothetical protein AAGJ28_08555 [Pseudomonadota bacterium]